MHSPCPELAANLTQCVTKGVNEMNKLIDILLGKPKAHQLEPGMNRKQKRVRSAQYRKRMAAPKRLRHEGRGR